VLHVCSTVLYIKGDTIQEYNDIIILLETNKVVKMGEKGKVEPLTGSPTVQANIDM